MGEVIEVSGDRGSGTDSSIGFDFTTLGKLLPTLQGGDQESIQRSYPLQNPYDRTSPVTPLAGADRLPGEVSRFLDQLHRGDFKRRDANDRVNIFEKTDENGDNMISWGEFQKEVQGHQSKTDAETLALWNRYKPVTAASMSAETFQKLAGTGFAVADLQGKSLSANENTRTDTTGSVSVICPINLGYWGGLVRCPKNRPVVGARLKFNFVKKQADNTDNSVDKTALNAVELRCGEPLTEAPAGPLPSITATTTPPSAAASAPINSDVAKTLPATDTVTTTIDPKLNPGQNGVPNPYTTGLVQKETALERATSALEANVHLGEHMMMEQGEGVITTITEKSSDGTRMRDFIVLKSAEGKDGIWSEWNDCPSHGEVRGFRSRMSVFEPERDNSALNDLAFICDKSVSSTDVPKDLILRFGSYTDNAADLDPNGAGKTVFTDLEETNLKPYPAGELPTIADPKTDSLQTAEGGWSRSLGCGGNRFVCGFQTRLLERASDNMGLTDLKLFCCKFVQ